MIVCLCVCVCVYMYVCVCMCLCVYIYVYVNVYIYIYIYIYIGVCVCACVYIYMYIYTYIYIYIYMYVCVYVYIYILVYTACVRAEVMELFSTGIRTCIGTEFVVCKLLPWEMHTHAFRLIPVTDMAPCWLFILTLFLTALAAGIVTEVMGMGGLNRALMPPSESTRRKLFPLEVCLRGSVMACLIFRCLWCLVMYLCQPRRVDSCSHRNRIFMLQTASSVIYNVMFSLYLDPLPSCS